MSLANWIARRYLRSKKSHGAVSAIALVSIAGVAIATAAVVCVLSVFNGFRDVLESKLDSLTPDITVTPANGKAFENSDSLCSLLLSLPGVEGVNPVVSDKAIIISGGREMPVTVKGVDPEKTLRFTGLEQAILPGGQMAFADKKPAPDLEDDAEIDLEVLDAMLTDTVIAEALPSVGVATRMGNLVPGETIRLLVPKRNARYNSANPGASFVIDSLMITGVFETKQREFDENTVIVPIGVARNLFQYSDEATSFEVFTSPGADIRDLTRRIESLPGGNAVATDRARIHEINFRMINIEKWVSFLLLAFILMIAGFNIISTMTMLVLEKRRQISIMSYVGMSGRLIGGIFSRESLYVSLTGGVAGIIIGVVLCLLQQEFGLIRLAGDPSTLLMSVYPVKIVWTDVALAFVPCVVLGILTAFIAGSFARQRVR